MNTFTVVAYILSAGGHHVEAVEASDSTSAALQVREKLGLARDDFEIVVVARGSITFEAVDKTRLALAPYSATSP